MIQCLSERIAFNLGNGPFFSLSKEGEKKEWMDEDEVEWCLRLLRPMKNRIQSYLL